MAREALAVETLPNHGSVTLAATAAHADGNAFVNDGKTLLIVRNGDVAPKEVTVKSVPCSHGRAGDVVKTVAAGATAVLGPFDQSGFNQAGADVGKVFVDYDAVTTVTVDAVKLG